MCNVRDIAAENADVPTFASVYRSFVGGNVPIIFVLGIAFVFACSLRSSVLFHVLQVFTHQH